MGIGRGPITLRLAVRPSRPLALCPNAARLVLALIAYGSATLFSSAAVYEENLPWLPALGISYHRGADGITIVRRP